MLLAFSLTHVILYGQKHKIGFAGSLTGRTQERVAFAMFLYAVLALPYPGSLFMYHLFLIARGETTREYLNSHKFPKKDRHRPFSQSSWIRNWLAVLLRPRTPTYLQFKKPYYPGDVRFGYTVPRKQRKRELRDRYSVQGTNGAGFGGAAANAKVGGGGGNGVGSNKTDVEMKQLPPLPPPTAATTATTTSSAGPPTLPVKPQMAGAKSAGAANASALSGPVNSTPR
jgi:palmitoyltransferase ZDHHC9/14/18